MMKNGYAMLVLTGGEGSRLRPLTNEFNKASMPIYYNDCEIIRIIDIPLSYCKNRGYPVYVQVNTINDTVLETIKKYDNVHLIVQSNNDMFSSIRSCLKLMVDDGIEYYSCYASDFIVSYSTLDTMIMACEDPITSVNLVSKEDEYSKIDISIDKDNYLTYSQEGKVVKNLTFNVRKTKEALKLFMGYDLSKSFMENLYPISLIKKQKVLCLEGRERHIDAGTPEAIYNLIYELNKDKQDKNGNICFPGSIINENSSNVIALPNSDSKDFILNDCIIPENEVLDSFDQVLKIAKKRQFFSKINIKDFYKNNSNTLF